MCSTYYEVKIDALLVAVYPVCFVFLFYVFLFGALVEAYVLTRESRVTENSRPIPVRRNLWDRMKGRKVIRRVYPCENGVLNLRRVAIEFVVKLF